jgi:PhnB protein
MQIFPYLHFNGRCDEAIEFYKHAVGAETTMLIRFKDAPDKSMISPGSEDKVMHANLRIGEATILVSDGRCSGKLNFDGFSLSATVRDDAEAQRVFAALSDGGQVTMPIAKTFFASSFGMLVDRFGVSWMVYVGS